VKEKGKVESLMNDSALNLPKGYMGKILTVDLTKRRFQQDPLNIGFTRRVFGGRGLGIALLIEHFNSLQKQGKYENPFRDVNPLSEDNLLIFSTSPLTGTGIPASGRIHVNFKSPLTDGIGSSNSGGFWAVSFKKTGHDVLRILGKSESPIYLRISSSKVEFLDAAELSNLNADELTHRLLQEVPKGAKCMVIGEAGRKLSKIAAIMNDGGRAMGRGGGGAVMGSKNLLAIVVYPDQSHVIEAADPHSLRLSNAEGAGFKTKMKLDVGKITRREKNFGILSSMGTLGLLGMVDAFDELIHNNMRDTKHASGDIAKITGEALRNHSAMVEPRKNVIEVKKGGCFNCPILCTRLTQIKDSQGQLIDRGEGPEFETVALLGANLSIYDLEVITEANYWANRYGLDTISLGATIAAFFELHCVIRAKQGQRSAEEQEYLSDIQQFVAEFGAPVFGRKEILLPLVHAIGKSEGIGKVLAEGSHRFCRRYGHSELSMSVKKLEIPAYDPRAAFLQGLAYEMSNRGGCHLQNGYSAIRAYCAGYAEWPRDRIEGSAIVAKNAALNNTAMDVMGVCTFASISVSLDEFADLVNAVTGLSFDAGQLQKIAWRTLTLERLFNIHAGLTSLADWLPDRFYEEDIEVEGHSVHCSRKAFEQMHLEYYKAMGWDENGMPTESTLLELDIADLLPEKSVAAN
jgi:aldehyde:ferredoxin oxidoreductase